LPSASYAGGMRVERAIGNVTFSRMIAFLLFVLVTVGLSWPLLSRLDTALAGVSHDVYINPWADWWTKKAFTEGLDFYHTSFLFYPQGVSLVFHSFSHVTTAVSLLLSPWLGQFPAYNLAILVAYPLAAYAMYLLAYYLTGSRPSAFVAGLVYAFQPYHIFESAHPVLLTTQWIPLFALAVIRTVRGAAKQRVSEVLLGGLWFLLTALSSWHLMIMLSAWAVLYVAHGAVFERRDWAGNGVRRLILLALTACLLVGPFLWPIAQEYIATDEPYVAVSLSQGRGNDLLSFLVPNTRHPVLGPLGERVNDRLGLVEYRPGYLGYVALGLAILGAATAWRETRFWVLSGLLFLVLSLGLYVQWGGASLHSFMLPWAAPVVRLLRHPFRLNVLLFFSLAVVSAFGCRRLLRAIPPSRPALRRAVPFVLSLIILFEYLVWPFPYTEPVYSPFFDELAREEGDFAVAHIPMGRRQEKFYLYYQTIHGKRITGGVVSRMPEQAYAFIDANPVLGALRGNAPPWWGVGVGEAFGALASQGIRYVIVQRDLMDAGQLENWHRWVGCFPPPVYSDASLSAYSTAMPVPWDTRQAESRRQADVQLGDDIHLESYQLSSSTVTAGDVLYLTLFWTAGGPIDTDYHVFVHVTDGQGALVAQHDSGPAYGALPTYQWSAGDMITDEHSLFIDPGFRTGHYVLSVGMYDYATMTRLTAVGPDGEEFADGVVVLQSIEVADQ